MEVQINQDNFQQYANSDTLLILDFWATWCGPCRALAPTLAQIAKEYEGKLVVGKADVDENEDLSEKYGIRNVPTVLFIRNGEVVDKFVGALAKPDIVEKIEAVL